MLRPYHAHANTNSMRMLRVRLGEADDMRAVVDLRLRVIGAAACRRLICANARALALAP